MSIPIVWGTQMMGKVDAVPGVGHVATRFFYLQYVPLIPLETYLVFREVGGDIHGVRIAFSPKSILTAWLRTGCVVAAIGLVIAAIICFSDRHAARGVALLFSAALCIAAFVYSYYFGPICRAGYHRAVYLADLANLAPEQRLALEITFGRMSAEQADLELARIYAEAEKAHEQQLRDAPPPQPPEPPFSPDQFVFK
jgi:hypothetical protein